MTNNNRQETNAPGYYEAEARRAIDHAEAKRREAAKQAAMVARLADLQCSMTTATGKYAADEAHAVTVKAANRAAGHLSASIDHVVTLTGGASRTLPADFGLLVADGPRMAAAQSVRDTLTALSTDPAHEDFTEYMCDAAGHYSEGREAYYVGDTDLCGACGDYAPAGACAACGAVSYGRRSFEGPAGIKWVPEGPRLAAALNGLFMAEGLMWGHEQVTLGPVIAAISAVAYPHDRPDPAARYMRKSRLGL